MLWVLAGPVALALLGGPPCLAQRLGGGSFEGCTFEVVMVDDRPWKRLGAQNMPYWVMSALLNYAYASRFAYAFRLVRPIQQGAPAYPGWNKVLYLRDRLEELDGAFDAPGSRPGRRPCAWLLYLDADAFVRESDLALPAFLAGLAGRYPLPAGAAVVLAREANLSGSDAPAPEAAFLNTGVLLLRAGTTALRLLNAWLLAGQRVERRRLWTVWPGEQGILSEMLLPGSYPAARGAAVLPRVPRRSFAAVNMTEMNSPWGRFVQHSWGKTAMEVALRDRALRDALLRLDCLRPACLAHLRQGARDRMVSWAPRWGA